MKLTKTNQTQIFYNVNPDLYQDNLSALKKISNKIGMTIHVFRTNSITKGYLSHWSINFDKSSIAGRQSQCQFTSGKYSCISGVQINSAIQDLIDDCSK